MSRLALTALFVAGAASASANVLVVRSSGPSAGNYPAGRSLPDNARIALRSGDTLVVLDARGTRTFRGPGNFTPASAAQAGQRTTNAGGRVARIGAVRSAGIVPASPSTIWQVDVSQSGTVCLANPGDVTLWRAEPSRAARLSISGPGGASRTVQWAAGSPTVAWPRDLPITAGTPYQLRQSDAAAPTSITFRQLNSAPGDMQGVAQALIANGCQEQLDLLVDSAPAQ
ncbi:hypothetical protein RCO27_03945 [Sphingosinicella sp. LHD-64]|uniref:hypothetical protein n=1 Tax=Sphingosinicella sp. LHD-64 TaxID=3072139 RepID=UPI0028103806|nr:hypothetical protein [Sphingosinicella sp. LHD-64]MDQ8755372.1 hypothetical protein [Sphingosinicella sp. LHD-64]